MKQGLTLATGRCLVKLAPLVNSPRGEKERSGIWLRERERRERNEVGTEGVGKEREVA